MEQKNKRKSKFALLLVHEKEDGTIRQHHINSLVIELSAFLLFILAVVAVCQIVYKSILIDDIRKETVDHLVSINNLTNENEVLEAENSELTNKVAVLSETVAKKVAVEEVKEAEVAGNSLPKGFPLSGSASMEEAEDDALTLIFHAAEGNNVVTAGSGTVESIGPDEKYGTKLVLDHQNGYKSIYYNQGTPLVKVGEELGKGYILFSITKDNKDLGYQIMEEEKGINPMDMIEISG